MLHDTIDELREEPGGEIIDAVPRSIWLKVLLAHSVEWGAAGSVLDEILRTDENSRQFKEYVTRLIGYGSIDPQRVQECNAYRVTALGGGVLVSDRSHIHRYPLPPALSGQTGYRRLVITLAWFTPVNPPSSRLEESATVVRTTQGSSPRRKARSPLASRPAGDTPTRDTGRIKSSRFRGWRQP